LFTRSHPAQPAPTYNAPCVPANTAQPGPTSRSSQHCPTRPNVASQPTLLNQAQRRVPANTAQPGPTSRLSQHCSTRPNVASQPTLSNQAQRRVPANTAQRRVPANTVQQQVCPPTQHCNHTITWRQTQHIRLRSLVSTHARRTHHYAAAATRNSTYKPGLISKTRRGGGYFEPDITGWLRGSLRSLLPVQNRAALTSQSH